MSSAVSGASASSTGLGQGIDVTAFVTAALAGDQANITQVQNQKTAVDNQSKALAQITAELQTLQSAIFSLKDPLGSLAAQSATSSNSAVLGATASSSAIAATHSITVNSLATTSSYYTNAVASSSTTLANGSFTVQVGSAASVNVTIDSTNNTLDKLAVAINNLGAGVRASVINDANGSRLARVSETTGAPGPGRVQRRNGAPAFTRRRRNGPCPATLQGISRSSSRTLRTSGPLPPSRFRPPHRTAESSHPTHPSPHRARSRPLPARRRLPIRLHPLLHTLGHASRTSQPLSALLRVLHLCVILSR